MKTPDQLGKGEEGQAMKVDEVDDETAAWDKVSQPLLDGGKGKKIQRRVDCSRRTIRGKKGRRRPQKLKGKVDKVPTVRDWTIMETRQHKGSMPIRIKTRGGVRVNTPHGVTISHTVGCLPSVHEAMNSAEDEV